MIKHIGPYGMQVIMSSSVPHHRSPLIGQVDKKLFKGVAVL